MLNLTKSPALRWLKAGWRHLWRQDPWVLLMGAICVPTGALLFCMVTLALQPVVFWGGLIASPILAAIAVARFLKLLLYH